MSPKIKSLSPTSQSSLSKITPKKIDVKKFEILANKVKKILEEEEERLQKDNGYIRKPRLSYGS